MHKHSNGLPENVKQKHIQHKTEKKLFSNVKKSKAILVTGRGGP
jgi:hypothetical protein